MEKTSDEARQPTNSHCEHPAAAREAGLPLTMSAGLAAGASAGLVMSGWKMGLDALHGRGVWSAPQLIATIVLGPAAYDGGYRFHPMPVLVGLALHEGTSAAMGLVYVPLVRRPALGRRRPLVTAVAYALVSWAVYQYAVMPWLAPVMNRHTPPAGLAIAHAVLGLALGRSALWFARHAR